MRSLRALAAIDLKGVARDPLLRWIGIYPIVLCLALRWGVPLAATALRSHHGFDLEPYFLLITSFMVLTMPLISGMVVGFLLLDQKDDGTLEALRVTPLGLTGYFAWRLSVPLTLSLVMSLICIPLLGLVRLRPAHLVVTVLLSAPLAPAFALYLAAFARNKVQGFALMKVSGIFSIPPMVAWFFETPEQYLFGVVPHYWCCRLLWSLHLAEPGAILALIVGLVFQILVVALLLLRLIRSS